MLKIVNAGVRMYEGSLGVHGRCVRVHVRCMSDIYDP